MLKMKKKNPGMDFNRDETREVISLALPRRAKYIDVAGQLKGDSRKRWEEEEK